MVMIEHTPATRERRPGVCSAIQSIWRNCVVRLDMDCTQFRPAEGSKSKQRLCRHCFYFGSGANYESPQAQAEIPEQAADKACPGNVNRLRLDAFDDLLRACKALMNKLDDDIDCDGAYDLGRAAIEKADKAEGKDR